MNPARWLHAWGQMPAWFLAIALLSPADVPIDVQVPAFLKALAFAKNFHVDADKLVIGVVYDPADGESASTVDRIITTHTELTRMLVKGKGVAFVPIAYTRGAPLELGGSQVLVAAPLPRDGVELVAKQGGESNLLTFSTTPRDVELGLALGMELANGKPGFVVNLAATAGAGAAFEAKFLALCRIVER